MGHIDVIGDLPSGDFSDFAVSVGQVEELGEGLPHIPFVVPGPTHLELFGQELLQHLRHQLLTEGGVLVGQVERHHVRKVGAERAEPFHCVEQFGFSFPEFSDWNRGRGLLSQETFSGPALREEPAGSPFISHGTKINGIADDFAVASLRADGGHPHWARQTGRGVKSGVPTWVPT